MASLMGQVWPEGAPDAEIVAWALLSADRRELAERRMAQLLAYESAGATAAAGYAQRAGVSLPQFFRMWREWRVRRSISAVVPVAGTRARRSAQEPDELLGEAVRAEVRARRRATKETLARALFDRFGTPSLSYMRRLVDAERSALAREEAGGAEGFGARVLLDAAAVLLPLYGGGDEPDWAVVGLAVDVGTGAVLGHALGRHETAWHLNAVAARSAIERLRTLDLVDPHDSDRTTALTVVVGEDDPVSVLREMNRLMSLARQVEVVVGDRRAGSEILKAVGRRLGALEFRPRLGTSGFQARRSKAAAIEESGLEPVDEEVARKVIAAQISSHNAERLHAHLRPAVSPADVAEVLDQAFPAGLSSGGI